MSAATNAAVSAILDHEGRPHIRAGEDSWSNTAHQGADQWGLELRTWQPPRVGADAALLPELDTLRSRTHDVIRNHGLTSGACQTHLDNIIGGGLRLSSKPDWRVLGQTATWARTWARETESWFRQWAEDIDCYCDVSRRLKFGGMLSQGYRSYLQSFEILAVLEWLPDRGGRYATAVQMVDPARLCNPDGRGDTERMRGGIEFDEKGAPIAYHICSHLQGDPYTMGIRRWKRVERFTPWGRPQVIHIYDEEMPGLSRGKNGIVSVLSKIKMLEKFETATLQAAILNAMYAATIESSMDWESVGAALGAVGGKTKVANNPISNYMNDRAKWHSEGHVRYGGVKIPHLYPGEKLELTSPEHPSANFASFEEATLRHIAGGLNLSYEQLSRDYSKTNYSSARAAMLETWKFFTGRRTYIAGRFASLIYAAWLEEAIDMGDVKMPAGAPHFLDAKTAWARCQWIGPGRGHVDPERESAATETEYGMCLTTLEKEAAERGEDWEELLEQRAVERDRLIELGFDPDKIGRQQGSAPANQQQGGNRGPTDPNERRERDERDARDDTGGGNGGGNGDEPTQRE